MARIAPRQKAIDGRWFVASNSFSSRREAQGKAERIRMAGEQARVIPRKVKGKTQYDVYEGS